MSRNDKRELDAVADSVRAEIVARGRAVWGGAQMVCGCGAPAKDGSCYCQKCEDEIYRGDAA